MDVKMLSFWFLVIALINGALSIEESSPPRPLDPLSKYSSSEIRSRIPPLILFDKFSRNDFHLGDVEEKVVDYPVDDDEDVLEDAEEYLGRRGVLEDLGKDLLPAFLWYPLSYSQQTEDILENQKKASVASVLNQIEGYYLPNERFINDSNCLADLDAIHRLEDVMEITMLVDSWGKVPDGYLAGNTYVFGSFDECLKVKFSRNASDPDQGDFRGQYCSVSYKKTTPKRNENNEISVQMTPLSNGNVLYSMYGTCIPASCSARDLQVSIDNHLQTMGMNLMVSKATCQAEEHLPFEFTPGAIVMIVILAVEGSLILFSGLLDLWISYAKKDELRKGPLKYLLVFSLATNLEKMFRINTSESKEAITCFYGMRVLSMAWVVMGHQYMYQYYSVNKNLISDLFNGKFAAQIILNAYTSVETFFYMSGFLVAYVFFKDLERGGKFNIFLFYFHRFIRLSPPIMLWSGFLAAFQSQLARGPMADRALRGMENCRKFWYRDAFFMSNYEGYGEETQGKCLGVSWYTSVDSQLYLASPLFFLPFILAGFIKNKKYNSRFTGILWLLCCTVLSCIIPGIIIGVNHLPPNPVRGGANYSLHHKLVYYKPWCRASPYLVGIALAYFIRTNKKEVLLKPWQVILGWITATGFGVAVVFGMYRYNQITTDLIEYEWAPSIFYGSLHSLVWALAVSWVVFACHYGYGGPINSFLSHPSFQPLNRLTYCIFLVAFSLQGILNYNLVVAPYFSHLNKIIEIVGIIFIAGIGGILLSLFTEGPILGLEKILLRK